MSAVLPEIGFSVTAENCRRTCPFSDYPDSDSASAYTYQTILAVIAVALPAMTWFLFLALFCCRQNIEPGKVPTRQARKQVHRNGELGDVSVEVSDDHPKGINLNHALAEHNANGTYLQEGRATARTFLIILVCCLLPLSKSRPREGGICFRI